MNMSTCLQYISGCILKVSLLAGYAVGFNAFICAKVIKGELYLEKNSGIKCLQTRYSPPTDSPELAAKLEWCEHQDLVTILNVGLFKKNFCRFYFFVFV